MSDTAQNDNPNRVICGNFDVTLQVSQQRTLRVTGYFYSDDALEEMHKRVDIAQEVIDRQAIRADIVTKEAQVEAIEAGVDRMIEDFQALKDRQAGGKTLTSQQKTQLASFDGTLRQQKSNVEMLRAAIAKGRTKINGVLHQASE